MLGCEQIIGAILEEGGPLWAAFSLLVVYICWRALIAERKYEQLAGKYEESLKESMRSEAKLTEAFNLLGKLIEINFSRGLR